jgi:hypothetical protein
VNPPPNLNTQVLDATTLVATASGGYRYFACPQYRRGIPDREWGKQPFWSCTEED